MKDAPPTVDELVKVEKKELESTIENRNNRKARADGWWVRKFKSPHNRAEPDRIYIKEGRHVFVEWKRPNNTPTELQWEKIDAINAHSGEAYWCDNDDDFAKLLGIGCDECKETQIRLSNEIYVGT